LTNTVTQKKQLARKIFDFCFEFQARKEVNSQLKWKIGAGLFTVLIGLFIAFFFFRISLPLIIGGLYYAYINYKKLSLPVDLLRERSFIKKNEERRF